MQPLREIAADGYPVHYLMARLRGRRAGLVAAERRERAAPPAGAESDEAIWDALLTEFDWLRRQMSARLRAQFEPVLTLFAIKTLVLVLRNAAAERRASVERLMRHELFADDLRRGLVGAPDTATAVALVVDALAPTPDEAGRLAAAYAEGGLKDLEAGLMREFLGRAARGRAHPAIRRFFATFIDLRNTMTLYKQLRWGFQDAAAFMPGGTLAVARLSGASTRGDTSCLDQCVGGITGAAPVSMAAGEEALESRLLSTLTRRLHAASRDGDATELILDYVWSVYVRARNRALRLHAGGPDAAVLEREVIA